MDQTTEELGVVYFFFMVQLTFFFGALEKK